MYSVGQGRLGTNNDWLAIGGGAKLTSHLWYKTFEAGHSLTGYCLGASAAFNVYFQIDWFVRDTWLTNMVGSELTRYVRKLDTVVMDGVEWKHTRVTGMFLSDPARNVWIKFDFVLNSGILAYNDVRWSVRSGRIPAVDGDDYSGPKQNPSEVSTIDPWLRRFSVVERDDVESVEASVQEPVETVPVETSPDDTAPVYVGPASANYRVYTSLGDKYYYSLYHELLNRYQYINSSIWVLNSPSRGDGAAMFSQTPNGDGWLDLTKDQPSWDAGSWHPVYFSSKGAGVWAIGDGSGRFLAWANTPSVGAYASSLASFALVFTTDISSALGFEFVVV